MAEPDVEALLRELLARQAEGRSGRVPRITPSIPRAYSTLLCDNPPSRLALEIMALPLRPDFAVDAALHPEDTSRTRKAADAPGVQITEDVDPESLHLGGFSETASETR